MGKPLTEEDIKLIGDMDFRHLKKTYVNVIIYISLFGFSFYLCSNFLGFFNLL